MLGSSNRIGFSRVPARGRFFGAGGRRLFLLLPSEAGRFNFSWNNPTGRIWTYPAGTVLNSDGVTPITTSTDAGPDVIIPAGGGVVRLDTVSLAGSLSLNANDTGVRYLGNLSSLSGLTYSLNLSNCSQVTGDLSSLSGLTYYLSLRNCNQVTGDLSALQNINTELILNGCPLIAGAYTNVSGLNVPTTNMSNTGVSTADMDATLIAYAAGTRTGRSFTATGMTRSAASDEAVTKLTTSTGSGGLGWTVTGLTKV